VAVTIRVFGGTFTSDDGIEWRGGNYLSRITLWDAALGLKFDYSAYPALTRAVMLCEEFEGAVVTFDPPPPYDPHAIY
jgi:hypothetical protein